MLSSRLRNSPAGARVCFWRVIKAIGEAWAQSNDPWSVCLADQKKQTRASAAYVKGRGMQIPWKLNSRLFAISQSIDRRVIFKYACAEGQSIGSLNEWRKWLGSRIFFSRESTMHLEASKYFVNAFRAPQLLCSLLEESTRRRKASKIHF